MTFSKAVDKPTKAKADNLKNLKLGVAHQKLYWCAGSSAIPNFSSVMLYT